MKFVLRFMIDLGIVFYLLQKSPVMGATVIILCLLLVCEHLEEISEKIKSTKSEIPRI